MISEYTLCLRNCVRNTFLITMQLSEMRVCPSLQLSSVRWLELTMLFQLAKVALLEWTDDIEVFILKGYGKSLNYRMGVPLLKDVLESMDEAIKAREGDFKHPESLLN